MVFYLIKLLSKCSKGLWMGPQGPFIIYQKMKSVYLKTHSKERRKKKEKIKRKNTDEYIKFTLFSIIYKKINYYNLL